MDPIPAQVLVNNIHAQGIEAGIHHLRMVESNRGINIDRKEALYQIILAAQEADCSNLAAAAIVIYEGTQN